jgi:hypothetical protein
MMDSIRRSGYKPNEWEASFMQSLENSRFEKLTYKQTLAIENIYRKASGGGNYQKKQYGYRRP